MVHLYTDGKYSAMVMHRTYCHYIALAPTPQEARDKAAAWALANGFTAVRG